MGSSLVSRIPPSDESAGRIFVVDADEAFRDLMQRLLNRAGYRVELFATGVKARAAIQERAPDLVLLDLFLPDANGNDVLEEIRENPSTRLLPVVMVTGRGTREDRLRAQRSGVTDFLAKPVVPEEILPRVRSLVMLKRFADEHEHAEHVILMLAKTIDGRDSYTAGHSGRVAQYASGVALQMGMPAGEVEEIRRGALFHDIGKVVIPDAVLKKPTSLTEGERLVINQHPVAGLDLLAGMQTMRRILPIIYHHHERLDGSGYPDGIRGDEIPAAVRIVAVADVFDALTTDRAYRPALTLDGAWRVIGADVAGGRLDGAVVQALRAVVKRDGVRPDSPPAGGVSGLFR